MINYIQSIKAVILPMMLLLLVFIIDASVLFYRVLPEMHHYLRIIVCVLMGISLAFPLLLTAVNSNHLSKWGKVGFPELFSVVSFGMTLFFFDLPSMPENKPISWYLLVIFLSFCLALVDYLYASLFVAKLKQIKAIQGNATQVSDLRQKNSDLQKQVDELQSISLRYEQLKEKHEQVRAELKTFTDQLVCKYCGHESPTITANQSHQSRCDQNPNKKKNK